MHSAYASAEHLLDDGDAISVAAALLQVSEFQLFHIAYFLWFGTRIPDSKMEKFFCGYMFQNIVPFWVRNTARKVMGRASEGALDPREFNVEPPRKDPELKRQGMLYSALFVAIFLLILHLTLTFTPF